MKQLKKVLTKVEVHIEELSKMDAIEKEANETVAAVLAGGKLDDATEQNRLGTARFKLDLLPARRNACIKSLEDMMQPLWAALDRARSGFNAKVQEYKLGKRAEMAKLLEPYMGNIEAYPNQANFFDNYALISIENQKYPYIYADQHDYQSLYVEALKFIEHAKKTLKGYGIPEDDES